MLESVVAAFAASVLLWLGALAVAEFCSFKWRSFHGDATIIDVLRRFVNVRVIRNDCYPDKESAACAQFDVRKRRTFPVRKSLSCLVGGLALVVALSPARALAVDDGFIFYGPEVFTYQGERSYTVGIVATNEYDAAAYVLGYDPSDETLFTPSVKARLSNESTGGAFYTFAHKFAHPSQSPSGSIWNPEFWTTAAATYGYDRVWKGTYTGVEKAAAATALQTILLGGSGDGGSGSSGGGIDVDAIPDSVTLDNPSGYIYTTNVWNDEYRNTVSGSCVVNLTNKSSIVNSMTSNGLKYFYIMFLPKQKKTGTASYQPNIRCYAAANPITLEVSSVGTTPTYISYTLTCESVIYTNNLGNAGWGINCAEGTGQFSGSTSIGNVSFSPASTEVTVSCSYGNSQYSTFCNNSWNNTVSTPDPPNHWPSDDPQPTPTPPTVPGPTSPGPDDQPSEPADPTPPALPPVDDPLPFVPEDDNDFTADLQGILDAMNEHCIHLQTAIYNAWTSLYDNLGTLMGDLVLHLEDDIETLFDWLGQNLHAQFGWLGQTIIDQTTRLMGYLHDLFVWLASQMQFNFGNDYDDSSIIYWLKQIWSKLGSGINGKPTDPVADPFGIGGWLKQLWDNLIDNLFEIGQGLLGEIGQAISTLITKFPFCIPWDLVEILTMLVAPAVTPEVRWPMFKVNSLGNVDIFYTTISLQAYNSYMPVIHTMIIVGFIGMLVWRTKYVMDLLKSSRLGD